MNPPGRPNYLVTSFRLAFQLAGLGTSMQQLSLGQRGEVRLWTGKYFALYIPSRYDLLSGMCSLTRAFNSDTIISSEKELLGPTGILNTALGWRPTALVVVVRHIVKYERVC